MARVRPYYDISPGMLEPSVTTIWALRDVTEENGATRVIPGRP